MDKKVEGQTLADALKTDFCRPCGVPIMPSTDDLPMCQKCTKDCEALYIQASKSTTKMVMPAGSGDRPDAENKVTLKTYLQNLSPEEFCEKLKDFQEQKLVYNRYCRCCLDVGTQGHSRPVNSPMIMSDLSDFMLSHCMAAMVVVIRSPAPERRGAHRRPYDFGRLTERTSRGVRTSRDSGDAHWICSSIVLGLGFRTI